ncbi:hypothetical protein CH063_07075 [Colletotrichum higginsianum]|uniref:DUF7137 domain-containing protein n=2 Tax=Colletotrichum higginsianum TaxID=80884 RepID=H1V4V1_COLHI|nr:hypothetical protein CH63R_02552 [Colletotrichum higginsianum IMI 349063]OBR13826.1 hypothetical protein CH63R_02552 [Colletotrichum higginsianum IMI 349063]TID02737.1 hypothetical protein CH35J_004012 [Colletotrichum higginsianum]GJC95514.1 hypothetical protein ColKHC_04340 [Colletotrichum higginsianum]CCF35253.1 hypothetical protein CH063_07075 [Colletotrichum higginsianum]
MKAAQSLALGLAVLAPLASAWPKWLPDVDALVVRQNDESSAPAATETPASRTGATATPTATGTAEGTRTGGARTTNLNTAQGSTGTGTARGTQTGTGTRTGTGQSKSTAFDETDPQGSVVMITPAATAQSINLYKIGDFVTWGWNYTNLQATPTAIDVLVSCSSMAQTWTLTQNMSFAQPASFTWDSSVQKTDASAPLRNDEYTLVIYDAESSVSATAAAGYLGVSNSFKFGMYLPQEYKPLNEWNCAVCKSAAPSLNSKAIGMAVGMSMVTVASFTWFVAGLGMF